mgnify:FL=1
MRKSVTRCILILTALLASPIISSARPVLDFHVEWGYSQCMYQYHHYNILTSEGSRMQYEEGGFLFHPNGDLLVGVMFKPSTRSGISLLSGYAGIGESSTAIPFRVRYSFFFKTMYSDGLFCFAESGIGLKIATEIEKAPALTDGIGIGYRLKLTPDISMDTLLSVKCVFDKPRIPNPEGQGFVDKSHILSNMASYYAINASIAFFF